ncbi:MAG TPA: DPP IV N-terminal domain-containing protein [Chitinophagaceae bacterium]|jgi:TolB protein
MKYCCLILVSVIFCNHAYLQTTNPEGILEKKDVEYAYPRWSKDGKRILFQSNESGKWQLCMMDENGQNIRQITKDSFNNNFMDLSPDNKKIAFVSDRTGNEEIFVTDINGGHQKQLTFTHARNIHPYWSPKGDKIFFNSTRDDAAAFEIYVMNPDGSNVRRITRSADDETCARLSPSGNRLVYLKNNEHGLDDVFTMDLKNFAEQNITNTPTTDGWPCWLPEGNKILYSAREDGRYKLFIYDLQDNTTRRLTDPPSPFYDARAAVSADGKKIVFNRQIDGIKNTIGIYVLSLNREGG